MGIDRDAAHQRWIRALNRRTEAPAYRDEWYWEQCADCAHWCALAGPLGEDWGVCANAESPFDSRVRFEHDGCDEFQPRDENVSNGMQ